MGLKLNIGAGATALPGFTSWDIADGHPGFPLPHSECEVEEIYASHVLEHFPYELTLAVLQDWFRALAPGGRLRVAVPDLDRIVEAYLIKQPGAKVEPWLLGGHTSETDRHLALFNEAKLRDLLARAGFEAISPWAPEIQDCASLPVSLNLSGRKPLPTMEPFTKPPLSAAEAAKTVDAAPASQERREVRAMSPAAVPPPPPGPEINTEAKIVACISTPRLGFMDTFDSIYCTLPPLGIPLVRGTGVFWGQALTRAMEEAIETHHADWILVLDYDSVWTGNELRQMVALLNAAPGKIDALCPHQWNRQLDKCLWTPVRQPDGSYPRVTVEQLSALDLFEIGSGHFGLTFIRAAALQRTPHPWFLPVPNSDGRWIDGKQDDDIRFWSEFRKAGNHIYLAPKVTVGHLELSLRWPSRQMTLLTQHLNDYQREGKPAEVFGA